MRTQTKYLQVLIEIDEDGMFIGSIPAVHACHAQGQTRAEMWANLEEVLTLCLRNGQAIQTKPKLELTELEYV